MRYGRDEKSTTRAVEERRDDSSTSLQTDLMMTNFATHPVICYQTKAIGNIGNNLDHHSREEGMNIRITSMNYRCMCVCHVINV